MNERRTARNGCLFERLCVKSAASRLVLPGLPGIVCIGAPEVQGLPPLVLIEDEQHRNPGASATNAMEPVLSHLHRLWRDVLPLSQANIVERDSIGNYDLVCATWSNGQVVAVQWVPLRWQGCPPSSQAALEGAFGIQAQRVLAACPLST